MSGQPFGDPKANPYQAPQFGGMPGDSPELLSQANSAFNLALGAMFVAFCCCGPIGLVMGVVAMNNAGSVLALASPGSEANSKASTAKILGIVAIVLGVIQMAGGVVSTVINSM